jgi:hypothetical protein
MLAELDRLGVLVTKTGGPAEDIAFRTLYDFVSGSGKPDTRISKAASS